LNFGGMPLRHYSMQWGKFKVMTLDATVRTKGNHMPFNSYLIDKVLRFTGIKIVTSFWQAATMIDLKLVNLQTVIQVTKLSAFQ